MFCLGGGHLQFIRVITVADIIFLLIYFLLLKLHEFIRNFVFARKLQTCLVYYCTRLRLYFLCQWESSGWQSNDLFGFPFDHLPHKFLNVLHVIMQTIALELTHTVCIFLFLLSFVSCIFSPSFCLKLIIDVTSWTR